MPVPCQVPTNVRARLLGPGSVLVVCTDDITGPAAAGDGGKPPLQVLGTTTALLRKVAPHDRRGYVCCCG